MKAVQQLPERYRQIDNVDLMKNRRQALTVNVIAVLLAVTVAVPMHFAVPVTSFFDSEGGSPAVMLRTAVLLLAFAAYIVLHELTHGAVMKAVGGVKVKFGFNGMYAYAGSETDYFDKSAYLSIALAPVVIWGVCFGLLALAVPREWFWVVWFLQIGNVSGAAGDLYVTFRFMNGPKDLLVRDTGLNMQVFSQGAGKEN